MESYYRNWNPRKGETIEKQLKGSYNNSLKRHRDKLYVEGKPEGIVKLIKERVQYLRSLEKEEEDYHF